MKMELLNHRINVTDKYHGFKFTSAGRETGYGNMCQHEYFYKQWIELEQPLLRRLLQRHRSRGASRVVDFACGTGNILKLLECEFDNPIGIDVSISMLGAAQQYRSNSNINNNDISCAPLDSQIDIATAFRFFSDAKPQFRVDALHAIKSTLADDGVLIANIHRNSRSPLGLAHRIRNWYFSRTGTDELSYPEFVALLEHNGFEALEVHWYSFLPNVGWISSGLLGRLLLPGDSFCRYVRVPEWLCQSFVVVARKKQLS